MYVAPNTTFERECYDMIANEFEAARIIMAYPSCKITNGFAQIPYPTSSGINRTDEIFREYVVRYF